MNLLDLIILFVGKGILILGFVALFLTLLAAIFQMVVKMYKGSIGVPVLRAAVKAYRQTNPEAFKKYDSIK